MVPLQHVQFHFSLKSGKNCRDLRNRKNDFFQLTAVNGDESGALVSDENSAAQSNSQLWWPSRSSLCKTKILGMQSRRSTTCLRYTMTLNVWRACTVSILSSLH